MQVDGNGSGAGLQSEINITPLVAGVRVLLIIFMVVAPLLIQGYDADIPRVSAEAAPPPSDEKQVILSIGAAGCPIFDPPQGKGLPPGCHVSLGQTEMLVAD